MLVWKSDLRIYIYMYVCRRKQRRDSEAHKKECSLSETQLRYNVTLRCVHETIATVEK